MSRPSSDLLVEASQLKGAAGTYAWLVALGDRLATLAVVGNAVELFRVEEIEESPEGLRELPRTSLRYREATSLLRVDFDDLVTTTAFFRVPRSLYDELSTDDVGEQRRAVNAVFVHFGLNIIESAL